MKHILLTIFFLGGLLVLNAQQEPQYTQFMSFKLGYNPAYAGLDKVPTFTALVRSQWLGFEGAPQSQILSFNTPFGTAQRAGLGLSIRRFTLGPTEDYTSEMSYAYHVDFARGRLGMGIMGSVRLMRINFNQLEPIQSSAVDGALPAGIQSKYLPNFGVGFYYDSDNFYVGFSAPRLLQNSFDFSEEATIISKEITHIYIMGGAKFGDPDNIQWFPQVLIKQVSGAPFDADASITAIFKEKYSAGLSYRLGGSKESSLGESIALFLSMDVTEKLSFGIAYDYTLSDLKRYNNGTVEAVFTYRLGGKPKGEEFIDGRNPEGEDFIND
jgi:type IX secretion system PorP/SprF family membrane protein